MQVLENEIRKRPASLRSQGKRGFSILYPADMVDSLGFKAGRAGTKFEIFVNHKGELLARPIDPHLEVRP